jgi:hypothetical protein
MHWTKVSEGFPQLPGGCLLGVVGALLGLDPGSLGLVLGTLRQGLGLTVHVREFLDLRNPNHALTVSPMLREGAGEGENPHLRLQVEHLPLGHIAGVERLLPRHNHRLSDPARHGGWGTEGSLVSSRTQEAQEHMRRPGL